MGKGKICGMGLAAVLCSLLLGGAVVPSPAWASQKVFRKVTPEDNARASALQKEADEARLAGNYAAAIELYTKAIHLNERLGGYDGRAYCRFMLGDYEAAERDAETAMYNRSADDLLKAGVNGLAEYVRGMCLYKRGQYEAAERDLKAVLGTRYASDEARRAYADCQVKVEAEREAARLEKFRIASASLAAKVQRGLADGHIRAYDATRGETGWWRDEAARERFERTMRRPEGVSSDEFLHSITKYLWLMTFEGEERENMVVAFIPRHQVYVTANGEVRKDDVFVTEVVGADGSKTIEGLPSNTSLQYRYSMGMDCFEDDMDTPPFTWESLRAEGERRQGEENFSFGVSTGFRADIKIGGQASPTEYYIFTEGRDGNTVNGFLRRVDSELPPL